MTFESPHLHWFLRPGNNLEQDVLTVDLHAEHKMRETAWLEYLRAPEAFRPENIPHAILAPEFGLGAQERSLAKLGPTSGFPVAFDVRYARGGVKSSKGYLPLPDAAFFYDHILSRLPEEQRSFYQTLMQDRSCAWHFDTDSKRNANFDMEYFLGALFEEMCNELYCGRWDLSVLSLRGVHVTVAWLWENTLLLDAGCNVLGECVCGSCHGINQWLVFENNHTEMKFFAECVQARLEKREDQRLRDHKGRSALDIFYKTRGQYRVFGAIKLTNDPRKRRPLQLASYDRSSLAQSAPIDDDIERQRYLFLNSVVTQGTPVTVRRCLMAAETTSLPINKTASTKMHSSPGASCSGSALALFLRSIVRGWGNPSAYCYYNHLKEDGAQHLSFASVLRKHDGHTHESNHNVYCIVNVRPERDGLSLAWGCHNNDCPIFRQIYAIEPK